MRKACVIGSPVAHSLSPRLHGYWLKYHKLSGAYEKIDVPTAQLEGFIKNLPQQFIGCNVTLPHKETIIPLLDELDETARAIGAVNLVVVKNDKLIGSNTDAYGFKASLEQSAPKLKRGHALILGAGGAAKAVIYALRQMGFERITITNRSEQKAQALAENTIAWPEREKALRDADLLLNTTSLGMSGQPALELSLDTLPPHATVCDVVYKPLITPLLQEAQQRGLHTVDGLGMLLWQAVPAFEAFYGVRPEVTDALRHEVLS